MNTRRQTVWLVSMLSLMVVLSAYYLFTDNTDSFDLPADQMQSEGADVASTQQAEQNDDITVDEQSLLGAEEQDSIADATEKSDKADVQADDAQTGMESSARSDAAGQTDEEILDQLSKQASAGGDFFINAQLKRHDEMARRSDELMKIITDSSKDSDTIGKAYADMQKLEETQAKIENIEDELLRDFPSAVVLPTSDNNWEVVVQSDKLEKSQAVSIVDLVTKELNAEPGQVVVKYQP